jgi:hypothetical protein
MWASNWKAMGDEAASGKRLDLGAMLKGTGMTKVARIDTGLRFEPGFVELVDGFAREFGLQRIELPGGAAVAESCYERAKSCLAAAQPGRADQQLQLRGAPGADTGHLPLDAKEVPGRMMARNMGRGILARR